MIHRRLLFSLSLLVLGSIQCFSASATTSPNLLHNTRFLQCTNTGVPDWWGTGAPELVENWKTCFGVDRDTPLPSMQSLRLTCATVGQGFSVQSYAHQLPSGREYTLSIYLKADKDGVKVSLHLGDQTKTIIATQNWQRYVFTATPKKGWWSQGRLVVRFGLDSPGTLLVAAPQLEYGSQASAYQPADMDSITGAKATTGFSIPPNPLPLPSAHCTRTDTPPVIDGNLDDACYLKSATLDDFKEMYSGQSCDIKTEVYVTRDRANLYFAFRCHEPEMKELMATASTRDGGVFGDDCLEVFLQPDSKNDEYLHFAFNALGTQFDEKQYDVSWNAKWDVKTARGVNEWTAEMAIPFSSLDLTPNLQKTWRINVCRTRPHATSSRYSQWSCTYVGFHVPSRFGLLTGFSREDLRPFFVNRAKPIAVSRTSPVSLEPFKATFDMSYYTTEKTAQLMVRNDLNKRVVMSVNLREINSEKTLILSPIGSPGASPGHSSLIVYDISQLNIGEYDVTVLAQDDQGTEKARVKTSLSKLQSSAMEVKMDRLRRCLVINGKPFLVYAQGIHGMRGGWWLDDIAKHGFNTVIAGFAAYRSEEDLNRDEPKLRGFLDDCQQHKLKVVFWMGPGGGAYPDIRDAEVRTIKRFRDHPAILCWYLIDEPEGWWPSEGGKTEEDLVDLYRSAKAADPYRPSHINWCSWTKGKGAYGTFAATDIIALDRYPVGWSANAIQATGEIAGLMNDDAKPLNKPTAFWVQMYGYDDAIREPTPEEEKGMTYVCLIQGMRMIYYFIYKPMSLDLWESMTNLGEELRALEPILTDPNTRELTVGIESKRVYYGLWQHAGKYYFIACNASNDGIEVNFDLKRLTGLNKPLTSRTWFEKQPLNLRAGKLRITFKPNQRVVVELGAK